MNREQSVSWAGAEYHPDHTRCKYALPTIDLRCGQALPTTQFRPKQTHSRLVYAVSPLSPTHKTRFGLFPLEQWECSGEATHKGSSKASLGLCMRWPLNIRGTSFKIFIPSIHPFPLSVVIYSTLQTVLITMRSFYLFCWWSVRSVLPTVRSGQPTMLHHRNSSARTVCCWRMASCLGISTNYRTPYTGSMVSMDMN